MGTEAELDEGEMSLLEMAHERFEQLGPVAHPEFRVFREGDEVLLTVGATTFAARVIFGSSNGRSLYVTYGYGVDIETTGMALNWHDAIGEFRSVMKGRSVKLVKKPVPG
jgi:hypothetical protein